MIYQEQVRKLRKKILRDLELLFHPDETIRLQRPLIWLEVDNQFNELITTIYKTEVGIEFANSEIYRVSFDNLTIDQLAYILDEILEDRIEEEEE